LFLPGLGAESGDPPGLGAESVDGARLSTDFTHSVILTNRLVPAQIKGILCTYKNQLPIKADVKWVAYYQD
jgi:hypothetical protein